MRKTAFGDTIIENTDDDLGMEVDLSEAYATVSEDPETGKFSFDILDNVDGETRGSSDAIFENEDAVDDYLFTWLKPSDIQRM